MRIASVDPGLSGAIAYIYDKETLGKTFVKPLPICQDLHGKNCIDPKPIMASFTWIKPDVIVIEQVSGLAGQGRVSIHSFGITIGQILTIAQLSRAKIVWVSPQKWKKALGLLLDKKTAPKDKNERTRLSKAMAIAKCKELYPEGSLRPTARCTTDDDGFAEALLIGHWYKEDGNKA